MNLETFGNIKKTFPISLFAYLWMNISYYSKKNPTDHLDMKYETCNHMFLKCCHTNWDNVSAEPKNILRLFLSISIVFSRHGKLMKVSSYFTNSLSHIKKESSTCCSASPSKKCKTILHPVCQLPTLTYVGLIAISN